MENESNDFKHKWLALCFLALTVSLIVIDGTIVNVSLPVLIKKLNLDYTQAEWIVTIYSLVFSALLLTTGRIADHLGRKKMLLIGIGIFVLGSVLASFTTNIDLLLIARAIQGVGGAIVLPTTLSVVNSLYFGKDRIIAFAVWGSVISGMAALGPLVGGFITTYLDWHWIFLVNLPIGIIIFIGAFIYIPETFGNKINGHFDFIGFLLSVLSLGLIVFSLVEGRNYGWIKPKSDTLQFLSFSIIIYTLLIGILLFILFIIHELKRKKSNKSHILDVELFNYRSFSLGNIIACIVAIGESGLLFVLPLFLQNILAFTPMKAGALLAVMGIASFISGGLASLLVNKTSARFVVTMGLILESLGFFSFFLLVSPTMSLFNIVLSLFLYGLGLGFASAQLTSIVLVDVPRKDSGQGSAVQSTTRQLGSALGVAILGTIFVAFLQTDISNGLTKTDINKQATPFIESAIVNSAGSSISEIKNTDAENLGLTKTQKTEVIQTIDSSFSKSVSKTVGIGGLFMLSSVLLTFGFKRKKNKDDILGKI